jgi:hypothetical protein
MLGWAIYAEATGSCRCARRQGQSRGSRPKIGPRLYAYAIVSDACRFCSGSLHGQRRARGGVYGYFGLVSLYIFSHIPQALVYYIMHAVGWRVCERVSWCDTCHYTDMSPAIGIILMVSSCSRAAWELPGQSATICFPLRCACDRAYSA